MDRWSTLALAGGRYFCQIGLDGSDDVRQRDVAGRASEGISACFAAFARHEVGTLEVIEDLN